MSLILFLFHRSLRCAWCVSGVFIYIFFLDFVCAAPCLLHGTYRMLLTPIVCCQRSTDWSYVGRSEVLTERVMVRWCPPLPISMETLEWTDWNWFFIGSCSGCPSQSLRLYFLCLFTADCQLIFQAVNAHLQVFSVFSGSRFPWFCCTPVLTFVPG